MIALLRAKADGLWTKAHIRNNVLAGVDDIARIRLRSFGGRHQVHTESGDRRVHGRDPAGPHFHEKFLSLLEAWPTINPATTGLGLLALAILILGARFMKRIPAPLTALTALIVVTVVQAIAQFKGVATIGSAFGGFAATGAIARTATNIRNGATSPLAGVVVYSIEGPFFFAAAEKLARSLQHIQWRTTTLVLRLGSAPFVDATGIFALEQILADFKRHGAAVLFTEVRPNVFHKLERSGLIDLIGRENVFESLSDAPARAEQGLPRAARDGTVSHR
jgi:MFS superfamily sulfate permease-like transporter